MPFKSKERANAWMREYRRNNPDKMLMYSVKRKEWVEKNKIRTNERLRQLRSFKKYGVINGKKEKMTEAEKYERRKEYYKRNYQRIKENKLLLLKVRLRTRIYLFLKSKGIKKCLKTTELIGCTFNEAKNHIEMKFKEGMTWENYGEWHIDHIYPLNKAKNKEELYSLFNYKNLQPLWAEENMKKSDKIVKMEIKINSFCDYA